MLLTLIRDTFTPAETVGKLYIDRRFCCDTIEPPAVPDAQHPKGCIPVGWYALDLTCSPKFGRLLPLLRYVPGFEGIRIHAGNNRDHTSGCVLVGELYHRPQDGEQAVPTLAHSRRTEQTIVDALLKARNRHEQLYIDITDTERYPVERAILDSLPDSADGYR